jgi:hypothetical protein
MAKEPEGKRTINSCVKSYKCGKQDQRNYFWLGKIEKIGSSDPERRDGRA